MHSDATIAKMAEELLTLFESGIVGDFILSNIDLDEVFELEKLKNTLIEQTNGYFFDNDEDITEYWLNNNEITDYVDETMIIEDYLCNTNIHEAYTDEEIFESVINRQEGALLEWVAEHHSPEDVFTKEQLKEWAIANIVVEEE